MNMTTQQFYERVRTLQEDDAATLKRALRLNDKRNRLLVTPGAHIIDAIYEAMRGTVIHKQLEGYGCTLMAAAVNVGATPRSIDMARNVR